MNNQEPFRPAPRSQKESPVFNVEQGDSSCSSCSETPAPLQAATVEASSSPVVQPVRKRGCFSVAIFAAILVGGAAGFYYYTTTQPQKIKEPFALLSSSSGAEAELVSFSQLLKAAQAGNKSVYLQVAEAYANGVGTEQNIQEARHWYLAAEKSGSVGASLALAEMDYAAASYAAAMPRYTCALAELTAEQFYRLASCHYQAFEQATGEEAAEHARLAVHYYTNAATQQHAQAAIQLGHCYYKGIGVEVSITEAIIWFSVAAEQGVVEAQFRLAWCLMQQAPSNNELAAQWLFRAAEQGHAAAAYNLALCLLSGRGVEKNPQLALTYLQQAAEQNYTSAIRRLAFCYRDGEGSPRNLPLAVSCFARAAEHDAESAYNYAWCLHHGFGVEPNLPVALAWYVRAAQLQYPPAQEVLPSFRLVRLMPNFGLEWMLKSQNYPKM